MNIVSRVTGILSNYSNGDDPLLRQIQELLHSCERDELQEDLKTDLIFVRQELHLNNDEESLISVIHLIGKLIERSLLAPQEGYIYLLNLYNQVNDRIRSIILNVYVLIGKSCIEIAELIVEQLLQTLNENNQAAVPRIASTLRCLGNLVEVIKFQDSYSAKSIEIIAKILNIEEAPTFSCVSEIHEAGLHVLGQITAHYSNKSLNLPFKPIACLKISLKSEDIKIRMVAHYALHCIGFRNYEKGWKIKENLLKNNTSLLLIPAQSATIEACSGVASLLPHLSNKLSPFLKDAVLMEVSTDRTSALRGLLRIEQEDHLTIFNLLTNSYPLQTFIAKVLRDDGILSGDEYHQVLMLLEECDTSELQVLLFEKVMEQLPSITSDAILDMFQNLPLSINALTFIECLNAHCIQSLPAKNILFILQAAYDREGNDALVQIKVADCLINCIMHHPGQCIKQQDTVEIICTLLNNLLLGPMSQKIMQLLQRPCHQLTTIVVATYNKLEPSVLEMLLNVLPDESDVTDILNEIENTFKNENTSKENHKLAAETLLKLTNTRLLSAHESRMQQLLEQLTASTSAAVPARCILLNATFKCSLIWPTSSWPQNGISSAVGNHSTTVCQEAVMILARMVEFYPERASTMLQSIAHAADHKEYKVKIAAIKAAELIFTKGLFTYDPDFFIELVANAMEAHGKEERVAGASLLGSLLSSPQHYPLQQEYLTSMLSNRIHTDRTEDVRIALLKQLPRIASRPEMHTYILGIFQTLNYTEESIKIEAFSNICACSSLFDGFNALLEGFLNNSTHNKTYLIIAALERIYEHQHYADAFLNMLPTLMTEMNDANRRSIYKKLMEYAEFSYFEQLLKLMLPSLQHFFTLAVALYPCEVLQYEALVNLIQQYPHLYRIIESQLEAEWQSLRNDHSMLDERMECVVWSLRSLLRYERSNNDKLINLSLQILQNAVLWPNCFIKAIEEIFYAIGTYYRQERQLPQEVIQMLCQLSLNEGTDASNINICAVKILSWMQEYNPNCLHSQIPSIGKQLLYDDAIVRGFAVKYLTPLVFSLQPETQILLQSELLGVRSWTVHLLMLSLDDSTAPKRLKFLCLFSWLSIGNDELLTCTLKEKCKQVLNNKIVTLSEADLDDLIQSVEQYGALEPVVHTFNAIIERSLQLHSCSKLAILLRTCRQCGYTIDWDEYGVHFMGHSKMFSENRSSDYSFLEILGNDRSSQQLHENQQHREGDEYKLPNELRDGNLTSQSVTEDAVDEEEPIAPIWSHENPKLRRILTPNFLLTPIEDKIYQIQLEKLSATRRLESWATSDEDKVPLRNLIEQYDRSISYLQLMKQSAFEGLEKWEAAIEYFIEFNWTPYSNRLYVDALRNRLDDDHARAIVVGRKLYESDRKMRANESNSDAYSLAHQELLDAQDKWLALQIDAYEKSLVLGSLTGILLDLLDNLYASKFLFRKVNVHDPVIDALRGAAFDTIGKCLLLAKHFTSLEAVGSQEDVETDAEGSLKDVEEEVSHTNDNPGMMFCLLGTVTSNKSIDVLGQLFSKLSRNQQLKLTARLANSYATDKDIRQQLMTLTDELLIARENWLTHQFHDNFVDKLQRTVGELGANDGQLDMNEFVREADIEISGRLEGELLGLLLILWIASAKISNLSETSTMIQLLEQTSSSHELCGLKRSADEMNSS